MEDLERVREQLRGVRDPSAMLEGIFAFAPVGLQIYRVDGHSLITNRAFRDLFGGEPPPEYNVLQDEIAAKRGILDLIRRAFEGEVVQTPAIWYDARELRQVNVPEGRRVAIAAAFFPLFDAEDRVSHVGIVFKDETAEMLALERAEAERVRAEAESELLRLVVEQGGDGVIVADQNGSIRIFNPEAQRQHGVVLREGGPASWQDSYGLKTLDGSPLPLEETPLYRALRGERVEAARWLVERPDGSVRTLTGTATPLKRPDGSAAGAVLITRDETERLRMEEDLRRAVGVRDEFLSIAAHELRTPLSTMRLQTHGLLRRARNNAAISTASLIEKLESIERQNDRLVSLAERLLDVSRIAAGHLEIEAGPSDFAEVVREVVERMRQQLGPSGPPLDLEVPGSVPGHWDPLRLEQIVANLLSNAVRYGRGRPVTIRLEQSGGRARLSIRDEGVGIAGADQARIFKRFERAHPSRNFGGLGLGLWIVRQVVEAMAGNVSVESAPGVGSTFRVELPVHPSTVEGPQPG